MEAVFGIIILFFDMGVCGSFAGSSTKDFKVDSISV